MTDTNDADDTADTADTADTDASQATDATNATTDDLAALPPTRLGRYRHYKGGAYEVIGVARHSETHEPLVVYRPLYNSTGWWVRPHAMFFEAVTVAGIVRPRFEPLDGA